ncbi:hypothetical protein CKF54_01490 [Psittacicella hinzii]|uniref:Uncharacterized protein n=1 Tax=Psittacicella hinzii TaxID=2028575 RepID=A0A3A1Y9Y4_9GAMM|nr:DUF493 family protein [Psittacicella hinzii]RIY34136.1 hypothetical protein CKF54_01490 [Psittacicella hinzii]
MLGTKIPELMDFPSEVSFKVVGDKEEIILAGINKLMQEHNIKDFNVTTRKSSKGNYVSCSVTLNVESPAQMELLYTEFSKIETVRVVI